MEFRKILSLNFIIILATTMITTLVIPEKLFSETAGSSYDDTVAKAISAFKSGESSVELLGDDYASVLTNEDLARLDVNEDVYDSVDNFEENPDLEVVETASADEYAEAVAQIGQYVMPEDGAGKQDAGDGMTETASDDGETCPDSKIAADVAVEGDGEVAADGIAVALTAETDELFQTGRLIIVSAEEVTPLDAVMEVEGYNNTTILQFDSVLDAEEAYAYFYAQDGVYVQPDYVYQLDDMETDYSECLDSDYPEEAGSRQNEDPTDNCTDETSVSSSYASWGYGAYNTKTYSMNMSAFVNATPQNNSVLVAVIDTGIYPYNYLLKGRVDTANAKNTAGSGDVLNEGNGHGTHVSGTICDGTPSNVKILPIKAMTDSGSGYTTAITAGISYAVSKGASVINMSIGGRFSNDSYLDTYLKTAYDANVIMCAAAGNSGGAYADSFWPADSSYTISVAALTSTGVLASYSNYGTTVDIAAPGSSIKSSARSAGGTAVMSGTSMATPHVSAVAAVLKGNNKGYTVTAVRSILKQSASQNGYSGTIPTYTAKYGFNKLIVGPSTAATSGVINDNGTWKYYKKGIFQEEACTIANNKNGWWYIKDGIVDFTYTGLAHNANGDYYIKNGKAQLSTTGIVTCPETTQEYVEQNGSTVVSYTFAAGQYYICKGKVIYNKITVAKSLDDGCWYYVGKDAKPDLTVNTVAQNANGWWYVKDGKVDFSYTGIARNANGDWYIKDGKVNFSYTGMVSAKNTQYYPNASFEPVIFDGWYYVKGGKVDYTANTIAKGTEGWMYVVNGEADLSANTVAKNSNGWWYIRNGIVDFSYNGVAKNANGEWYIKNGKVQFNQSGVLKISACTSYYGDCESAEENSYDGWYSFKGGCLQRTASPTVQKNNYGWWYVGTDGKVDFAYNGFASNANGTWLIQKGKVNFDFTGLVKTEEGPVYYVSGGKCVSSTGLMNLLGKSYYEIETDTTTTIETINHGSSSWFYIVGGKLYGKNGETTATLANYNDSYWYIGLDGTCDFSWEGIVAYGEYEWYVFDGKVDFMKGTFQKPFEYQDENYMYTVIGGKVKSKTPQAAMATNEF